jgi:hypothetical protein
MSGFSLGAWSRSPWRCRQPLRSLCASVPACVLLFILAAVPTAEAATGLSAPLAATSPADVDAVEAVMPLTIQEAARLATLDQPLLTGRKAKIQAEEQQAVAAAQLPDPQLSGGLKELPIDTPEAFSVRRDNFTEFTIGLSQDFPRAEKRRLQGVRKQLDADADRAELDNEQRLVRRDGSTKRRCKCNRSRRTTETARRHRPTGWRRKWMPVWWPIEHMTGCIMYCEPAPV